MRSFRISSRNSKISPNFLLQLNIYSWIISKSSLWSFCSTPPRVLSYKLFSFNYNLAICWLRISPLLQLSSSPLIYSILKPCCRRLMAHLEQQNIYYSPYVSQEISLYLLLIGVISTVACVVFAELVEALAEFSPCIGNQSINHIILHLLFLHELSGSHHLSFLVHLAKRHMLTKVRTLIFLTLPLLEVKYLLTRQKPTVIIMLLANPLKIHIFILVNGSPQSLWNLHGAQHLKLMIFMHIPLGLMVFIAMVDVVLFVVEFTSLEKGGCRIAIFSLQVIPIPGHFVLVLNDLLLDVHSNFKLQQKHPCLFQIIIEYYESSYLVLFCQIMLDDLIVALLILIIVMQKNNKGEQQQSNITVAIRIRPLSVKEQNSGDNDIIRVQDNLIIILDPLDAELEQKKITDVLHRSKEQRYAFDKIYRNHTNENIYFQTTHPLIKTVLNGFNATVFAYGPTGTGKTYTMIGNQDTFGLNVLAIRDIFYYIEKDPDYKFDVVITYVEIYNEMIRDLLVPASGYLELRDDPEKGIVMAGVTQFKAESTEQVMNLLLIGNRRRTTQATNANLTSSRSHAVFQINIIKTSKTKNIKVENILGKLSLIDLAGSQRGTVTENRGIRLMEGAKINRSLLALANCINALGDKNKKGFFVPYRDSKLTRLLKDSLGGNCKTVMIVNVSPSSSQFQETINTLKYANRAKNIKTKAITNKKLVALHISEYKNIINDLHREIEQLKVRLSDNKGYQNRQNYQNKDKLPRIQSRHGKNIVGSDGVCTYCGRIDEKEQIKSIKQQIFQNFNERIQLRRAMMEIQEQNALNVLEMRKKNGEIALLKKNEGWQDNTQITSHIKEMTKVIQTLKLSTNKNMLKKQITNLQIMQSMAATKKIREDIMRKIRSKQNRDTLQIIIKNHVLQLQNIELQINMQIQERMITDMRQIILTQKNILQENGFEAVQGEQELPGPDEIEIQLEEEDQPEETHSNGEDEQTFDNFEDAEIQSYKNFEFGKNKYANRNGSAKKDVGDKRNRKQQVSFKKKDKEQQREKSIEKPPPINDFSLKGLKMNVKKKR